MKQQGPLRPRIVIGPGILMAILVAAVIAFKYLPERQPEHGRPKVERKLTGKAPSPALTIGALLKERVRLGLSEAQAIKLRALEARWERDTRADRHQLAVAQRQLEQWLGLAERSGERVAQAELQRRQQEFSRLSGRVAYWRRLYWKMALDVLTPEQRRRAEKLARGNLAPPPKEE